MNILSLSINYITTKKYSSMIVINFTLTYLYLSFSTPCVLSWVFHSNLKVFGRELGPFLSSAVNWGIYQPLSREGLEWPGLT